MTADTTDVLAWLGSATTRLLACADESSLIATVEAEVRRGLDVDRVGLTLIDAQRRTWSWALRCDEQGRPLSDNASYPAATFGEYIDLDRFGRGHDVAFVENLSATLSPLQRTQSDGPTGQNLAVLLRRTTQTALSEMHAVPMDDILGLLSVDNLPSGRPLSDNLGERLGIFGQIVAQAIESVRLREAEHTARRAAERQARREAALAELSGIVSTSLNQAVVAQRTVAALRPILDGADQIWLWAVSEDRSHLLALAVDGAPPEMLPAWSSVPLDPSQYLAARVVERNQAEFCEDAAPVRAQMPDGARAVVQATAAASFAILPLCGASGVIGVLSVIGHQPHTFPRDDRLFLEAVAGHIGSALSNARFVGQQRRAAARAERLLGFARTLSRLGSVQGLLDSIAAQAPGVLGCDRCAVCLLSDDGTRFVPSACAGLSSDLEAEWRGADQSVEQPGSRRLLRGEAIVVDYRTLQPERAATIHSSIALLLPLRLAERTIGYISISNSQRQRDFTPEEIALGQGMAHHAATAIETARLYAAEAAGRTKAEQHAAELRALVAGAHLLIGAATPQELAATGVQAAVQTLHADAGWAISCTPNPSPRDPRLQPLAWAGLPHDAAALCNDMPLDALVGGQAALRRSPVAIGCASAVPSDMPAVRIAPNEMQAYLAVPLIVQDRLLGALTVATWDERVWSDEDISLLQALANQMAAGLEAARLRADAAHSDAIREADRLKDILLSTVSHELRTPLGTIKGFTTALLEYDSNIDPQERREFLSMIDGASDRLRALVDDLLEVGRLGANEMRLNHAPTDLTLLIQDTIRTMDMRLANHPIRIDAEGLPIISADAGRLRQVLQNLLDNAAKYSPPGSPIVVMARAIGKELIIAITDRGIGIPAAHLARIFDRFHRVDSSRTRSVGGSGLGLSIARGIVEAHGGRIWATSDGENCGSTVALALPLTRYQSAIHSKPIYNVEPLNHAGTRSAIAEKDSPVRSAIAEKDSPVRSAVAEKDSPYG